MISLTKEWLVSKKRVTSDLYSDIKIEPISTLLLSIKKLWVLCSSKKEFTTLWKKWILKMLNLVHGSNSKLKLLKTESLLNMLYYPIPLNLISKSIKTLKFLSKYSQMSSTKDNLVFIKTFSLLLITYS